VILQRPAGGTERGRGGGGGGGGGGRGGAGGGGGERSWSVIRGRCQNPPGPRVPCGLDSERGMTGAWTTSITTKDEPAVATIIVGDKVGYKRLGEGFVTGAGVDNEGLTRSSASSDRAEQRAVGFRGSGIVGPTGL